MDYLVTGGAGFIGSNLVHALYAEGQRVRVLDDFSTGNRANIEALDDTVELVEGDLRDEQTVARAVAGVRCVFHLAALPSVIRSVEAPLPTNEVNVTGTLQLLLAARGAGVERFVFSSSSSVYGDTPELPKHEGMSPNPMSPYALTKLTGEHYTLLFHALYGLKTFVLRYFNVFGPRQNPNSQYAAVVPLFIDALRSGHRPTIFGTGQQTRDFTYVSDVVAANLACRDATDNAAGGIYNVARGDRVSVNDLAHKLAQLLGLDVEPEYAPPRRGEVRDSQADSSRARELLHWTPAVGLDEGLARTVEWFTSGEGSL
jgi:nucleoside-diphosphate-sugar epimerase